MAPVTDGDQQQGQEQEGGDDEGDSAAPAAAVVVVDDGRRSRSLSRSSRCSSDDATSRQSGDRASHSVRFAAVSADAQ